MKLNTTFTLSARALNVVMFGHIEQARVLLAVAAGARTHLEIARACDVPHPAVGPALNKLQRANLIVYKREGWVLVSDNPLLDEDSEDEGSGAADKP